MPDAPIPGPVPTLEELIERSRRLREQSDKLNREMRELGALILAAAKAETINERSLRKLSDPRP